MVSQVAKHFTFFILMTVIIILLGYLIGISMIYGNECHYDFVCENDKANENLGESMGMVIVGMIIISYVLSFVIIMYLYGSECCSACLDVYCPWAKTHDMISEEIEMSMLERHNSSVSVGSV